MSQEAAEDLALLIRQLKGEEEDGPFAKQTSELVQKENFEELASLLSQESSLLLTVKKEKTDLEGAYNLLLSFVKTQEKNFAQNLPKIIDPFLANDLSHRPSQFLNILINIYLQLDAHSPRRFDVFLCIVKFAAKYHRVNFILENIQGLEQWVSEWGASQDQKKQIFLLIRDIMLSAEQTLPAHKLLLTFLRTLDSVPKEEQQKQKEHVVAAVSEAIAIPNIFQFDDLLSLKAISAIESEPINQLLAIFTQKSFRDYLEFYNSHKEVVEKYGLSHEKNVTKLRLIALADLAAGAQGPISYQALTQALEISEDDVEKWVIDGIRCKLIDAKLDQLNKQVTINRTTYRVFGDDQWKQLKQKLEAWRSSIAEISQVVQNAKIVASETLSAQIEGTQ